MLFSKRLRKTKQHFRYEFPDEPIGDPLKKMETTFFNVLVDTPLASLGERFQRLGEASYKFGVLLNFPKMKEEILKHCQNLSTALTHDGQPGVDGN